MDDDDAWLDALMDCMHDYVKHTPNVSMGAFMRAVRRVITGNGQGVPVRQLLCLLGRETVHRRAVHIIRMIQ